MMRTFLVKRVMKPRRTAKTRPTRVPPMLTMRKEAGGEKGVSPGDQDNAETIASLDPPTPLK